MNGREIIECLIQRRAEKYDLGLLVRWTERFESGEQIANVKCGDRNVDLRFSREEIDDLPGHTRSDDLRRELSLFAMPMAQPFSFDERLHPLGHLQAPICCDRQASPPTGRSRPSLVVP